MSAEPSTSRVSDVLAGIPAAATGALLAALALGASATVRAAPEPALIIEAHTGAVVYAQAIDRPWHPASLTKMMTLYLTFEALATGALGPQDVLTVSRAAAAQPAVRLGLQAGATMTVAQAIEGVAVVSANDAAVVLAEAVAGSEEAFAVRMSAKAGELGMPATRFVNATGLPDARQTTSARDMAVLGQRLWRDFPAHYALFSRRRVEHAGRVRGAHNRLLGSYRGADGIKTGFTCGAGFNLVASAVRDGRRLIGVVLGGSSAAARDRRMVTLLDAAFARPAALGALPALDDWPRAGSVSGARAPMRLGREACASASGRRALTPGNLPGWGLLLGVFTDRAAGRAALRAGREAAAPAAGRGKEVLLRRDFERGTSWKALLVGFERDAAGRACKALWARQAVCLVQSPETMNRRGYESR